MLHGRVEAEEELARLLRGLAAGRAGALLVRGEAGAGKSALLAATAGRAEAEQLTVLRTGGVEAEADLPYATLDRLLRPVLRRAGHGGGSLTPLWAALSSADPSPAPHRVAPALLAHLAAVGPVVCLVDDLPVVDRESSEALLFLARRLSTEPVVMVLATEAEGAPAGIPELALTRLAPAAAAAVLAGHELAGHELAGHELAGHEPAGHEVGGALAPVVRSRVLREARGNPLALVEFTAALTEEQRLGRVRPPPVLPVRPAMLARFEARLTGLSEPARTLLAVVAADGTGDLPVVTAAAERLGVPASQLAEVEHLLSMQGLRLDFRHPMMGPTAYYGVSMSRRLDIHRELAELTDGRRRLLHLGAVTMTPDERLAAELEEAAGRRSDPYIVACLYQDAAQLSTTPTSRGRRLFALAEALLAGGDFARALPRLRDIGGGVEAVRGALLAGDDRAADRFGTALVGQARATGDPAELAPALGLLARVRLADGQPAAAKELLAEATNGTAAGLAPGPAAGTAAGTAREPVVPGRPSAEADLLALRARIEVIESGAVDIGAVDIGVLEPGAGGDAASGLAQLMAGDYAAAARILDRAWRDPRQYDWMTAAADLVEALVAVGRPESAEAPLRRLADWAAVADQPWADGVLARCRALLAGGGAGDRYDEAMRHHERGGRPFERARTALLYGEWLRRERRRSEARPLLRTAWETFRQLGAEPWAARAADELRASGDLRAAELRVDLRAGELRPAGEQRAAGEHSGGRAVGAVRLDRLTPQERRIVQLAASGASNRDIAAQLHLSPRTIEYHLYKAYPKLGIGSRRELLTAVPR